MIKFKGLVGLGCAALLAFGGQVMAMGGAVSEAEGKVLVQKKGSDKYNPAAAGTEVADGDKLMVMENAKVTITYDNKCKETIKGAKVVTISGNECKAAVIAGAGAGALSGGGGAFAAVVTGGAILVWLDDNDDKVSP